MKAWGLFEWVRLGGFLVCFVFERWMGRGYRDGEEPFISLAGFQRDGFE
jgi:hypothetical protein